MSVCFFIIYRSVCLHICLVVFLLSLSAYLFACLNVSLCVRLICCLSSFYLYLCSLSVRQFTCQSEYVYVCLMSIKTDKHGCSRILVWQYICLNIWMFVLTVTCIVRPICADVFPVFVCKQTNREIDRRTNIQTRHTDRQTYRQSDMERCTDKHTDRPTDIHPDRQTYR